VLDLTHSYIAAVAFGIDPELATLCTRVVHSTLGLEFGTQVGLAPFDMQAEHMASYPAVDSALD